MGRVVVKYEYDAWGNHAVLNSNGSVITSATNIGNLNPFRYRGYYYDTETGMYYLQTRYYDPELCRFMTIDSIENIDLEHINGLNLYAYCGNNPVMFTDPTGTTKWWEWLLGGLLVLVCAVAAAAVFTAGVSLIAAGALLGAAVGGGFSLISQGLTGTLNWGQFFLDFGVGAISGALGMSGIGRVGATIVSAVLGFGSSIASDAINGRDTDWAKAITSGLFCGTAGFFVGAGAQNWGSIGSSVAKEAGRNVMYGQFIAKMGSTYIKNASMMVYNAVGKSIIYQMSISFLKAIAALLSGYLYSFGWDLKSN